LANLAMGCATLASEGPVRLRPFPFGRQAVRVAQRLFDRVGFQLIDYRPPCSEIKDAQFYRPMFSPWLSSEWSERLHAHDPRSLVPLHAKYLLYCLALDATRRCWGEVAECGVYKGGTAKILAELVSDRPLHLFDTFCGMPQTDPKRDLHKAGDFADTTLESVCGYLSGHANVNLVAGTIPQSLDAVNDRKFCFVHIDLDIYSSIRAACEFFYPRLEQGGRLLFDDYGYPSCPGARAAVDEFFADKPETKIAMVTGQCSVQKL
ncbi:MAG: TylF/MycF/NovP-related O-methyltransferase, partial [Terriglobales bacterium]